MCPYRQHPRPIRPRQDRISPFPVHTLGNCPTQPNMIRIPKLLPACTLITAGLLGLAPDALADRIVTIDGRQIVATKARKEGEGYKLTFPDGVIILKDSSMIKAVEVEGDMSEYEPKNDKERDFLEKGYVLYRGKWMSKRAYQTELDRESAISKEEAGEAALYSEWGTALEGESKYFMIRTNTSPELLEYYGDLLDTYYQMMNKAIGIKPTPTMRGVKLQVNIYKSWDEFTKLTGMARGVAGFFMPMGPNSHLNFYHDYAEPKDSELIGLHECTHLLTYLIDQQFKPQIWINEAMADYYGSSTITQDKRGKLEIVPGKLHTDRVLTVQQAIKDDEAVGLQELFGLEKANFGAFQYAHAWSFVYFLNNGNDGKYQKGFAKFFKELYTLKGVESDNVPGYGPGNMNKVVKPDDIRDFLLKKIKVTDVKALEVEWLDFIASVPIDAPQARLKRGLRSAMFGEFESAIEDLTAAIDAGVTDPRAFAARARSGAFTGDTSKSVTDIEAAIELDPLNASYRYDYSHYLLGASASRYFRSNSKNMYEGNDALEQARAQAGLAVSLDPKDRFYPEWKAMLEE